MSLLLEYIVYMYRKIKRNVGVLDLVVGLGSVALIGGSYVSLRKLKAWPFNHAPVA